MRLMGMISIINPLRKKKIFRERLFTDFGFGVPKFSLQPAPNNNAVDYIFVRHVNYDPMEAGTSGDPIAID